MEDNKKPTLEDKEYDGIVEHDHPLPRWWVITFWLTIIFSVFYYGYYELMNGPTLDEELAQDLAAIEQLKEDAKAAAAPTGGLAEVSNPQFVENGKKIYMEKCFMCHGDKGQGLIGPNLTDNFWIHGKGDPESLLQVVKVGVPAKGMPGWEALLSEEEQVAAVAFLMSIKGQNIPGPKPAEGTEVTEQ